MAQAKSSLLDLQNFVTNKSGSIIYLCGEEEFFVEEALAFIKSQVLNEASVDFNYDLFYARDCEAAKIFDVVETLPMMAERRLVIVRKANELRDQDWKILLPALENPVDSTLLVFTGKHLDARKTESKNVIRLLTVFDFQRPFDREIPRWIEYICHKLGYKIEPDAVQLCVEIIGTQLLELQNELRKIGQYIGNKHLITASDVMAVASKIKLRSVFDLAKAIGQKDRTWALMCLAKLLEEGQNEVGILAMVQRHIRLLRQTRLGEQKGFHGRELATFAGVPPYFLNEYQAQARVWTEHKIEKTYKVLLDTDKALKSSPISSHIWLENFILQTCQ